MATNFPAGLDSFANPITSNTLDSPSHSTQHSDVNDAVRQVEIKLGIGASAAGSATTGQVLTATGAGDTAWLDLDGLPDQTGNEGRYLTTNGTAAAWSFIDLSINEQTGTTYTIVATDSGKLVELNNGSGISLTVPTNATTPLPTGTQINLLQTGAGQVTIAGAGGVTVNATPGLKLRTQWSSATLIKRATDTWVAIGDLSA
jgi:hypothetical protein